MKLGVENNPLFRPPAEAGSLILQIDHGCPHNRCTFCGMYKAVPYERLPMADVEAMIADCARRRSDARRIFLADGDVMIRPFDELAGILTALNDAFPRLTRVNIYANGSSINRKTDSELQTLQSLRLHTLYMGLESGDDTVLSQCRKGETSGQMVEAGIRARSAGLKMSVMVLLGLGGRELSIEHAQHTAEALNRMQPRLLSTLRAIPVPGTQLLADCVNGTFQQLTAYEAVEELLNLITQLELDGTVFRANHSSNVAAPEGRLPRDKSRLILELKSLLDSGILDRDSPGPMPLSL